MTEQTIFELIHSMDQITNRLMIYWNKEFSENLGVSHILVLAHLNHNGKSRPSDIAKALGLTPPTLTHLSEKLVKKEFAVRLIDEEDRRIIYLEITKEGLNILNKAQEKGKDLRTKLFEKLTEDERQSLLATYDKLNQLLDEFA
ncbi:MarR family transcriptional regulator [Paenibacillus stellifer]|uniref:MarR family transcriptional regulator n=2 Tax=Paenibacillus stellifer TaxID=169760 RepID=A0A089LY11_9BACL|nr:MarR family transcriptional regulator [Paenibacillus stellifer]AIQ64168.1 MarR family transcriptional regulator [Paenibacillus stellifer]